MEMHLSYSVFSDLFEGDVMNIWDYETFVNQYNAAGGTGFESVTSTKIACAYLF